jgi:hypothetical protein
VGFLGLLATIDHEATDTDDDGANTHGGHVVALGLLLGDWMNIIPMWNYFFRRWITLIA